LFDFLCTVLFCDSLWAQVRRGRKGPTGGSCDLLFVAEECSSHFQVRKQYYEFRLFYFPKNYDAIELLEVTNDISLSAYFNLPVDILPLLSLRFRLGPSTPTDNSDDAAHAARFV
jgi:hypothetical protein